jgi:hypothetical protein
MYEELSRCRELFLKMGGHPMAAGLSILPENVETLRRRLNENTTLTDDLLIPKVTIDIHLPLGYVTDTLIQELKQLEPFGRGNEKPLFAEKDLKIKSALIIGKNASGSALNSKINSKESTADTTIRVCIRPYFFSLIFSVSKSTRPSSRSSSENTIKLSSGICFTNTKVIAGIKKGMKNTAPCSLNREALLFMNMVKLKIRNEKQTTAIKAS